MATVTIFIRAYIVSKNSLQLSPLLQVWVSTPAIAATAPVPAAAATTRVSSPRSQCPTRASTRDELCLRSGIAPQLSGRTSATQPLLQASSVGPTHRHEHANVVAKRGYPEGCVAHSSLPYQRNARGARQAQASSPNKNHVTSKSPAGGISVVTPIRTDTTLDHAQRRASVKQ